MTCELKMATKDGHDDDGDDGDRDANDGNISRQLAVALRPALKSV